MLADNNLEEDDIMNESQQFSDSNQPNFIMT